MAPRITATPAVRCMRWPITTTPSSAPRCWRAPREGWGIFFRLSFRGPSAAREPGMTTRMQPQTLRPALELAFGQLADHLHARRAVVEAGDGRKMLAAIVFEDLGVLERDLPQRPQAIGGKTGRAHGHALHAFLGEP